MVDINKFTLGSTLNAGEDILREFVRGILLFKGWHSLKEALADEIQEFEPQEHKAIKACDPQLRFQLLLDVLGPEIREYWGEQIVEMYDPKQLRPPYISHAQKQQLIDILHKIYMRHVEDIMSDDNDALSEAKHVFSKESQSHLMSVLQRRKSKLSEIDYREDLASACVALMSNKELFGRLLAGPTNYSSYSEEGSNDSNSKKNRLPGMMGVDTGEEEVNDIVNGYDRLDVANMCYRLRGCILSERLRVHLYGYLYLTRRNTEIANTKNATPRLDYFRMMKEKNLEFVSYNVHNKELRRIESKLSMEDEDNGDRNNMNELICESVWSCVCLAMNCTYRVALFEDMRERKERFLAGEKEVEEAEEDLKERKRREDIERYFSKAHSFNDNFNDKENKETTKNGSDKIVQRSPFIPLSSLKALAKRAELLVHAAYVLNNEFSRRTVMIAIMLLHCLPKDAPTSDKILKIYQRILTECLPSELLHKDYSVATVAYKAWEYLLDADNELAQYLRSINIPDSVESTGTRGETPRSLILLRGWLEDAFLGWFSENTVMYIWDQVTLFGGCPQEYQSLLPVLCCILLQLMRGPLMSIPKGKDLFLHMREAGQALKTKNVVEAIRKDRIFSSFPK